MATLFAHGTKVLLVSTNVLANGRGRWLAIVASLVVAAAMIYAQDTKPRCCVQTPAATPTATAAPTPKDPAAAPPAPHIATQAEAEQLAALAATAVLAAAELAMMAMYCFLSGPR